MQKKSWLVWLMVILVLLVDSATLYNVIKSYAYFENSVSAVLVGLAFVMIQVVSLILFGQRIPQATKRWLLVGTALLLGITGVSNVAMGYLHASSRLPVDTLVHVFIPQGSPQALLVSASWLFNLALVVVGLIVWTAIAQWLRGMEEVKEKEVEERKDGYKKLEDLAKTRRDGGRS